MFGQDGQPLIDYPPMTPEEIEAYDYEYETVKAAEEAAYEQYLKEEAQESQPLVDYPPMEEYDYAAAAPPGQPLGPSPIADEPPAPATPEALTAAGRAKSYVLGPRPEESCAAAHPATGAFIHCSYDYIRAGVPAALVGLVVGATAKRGRLWKGGLAAAGTFAAAGLALAYLER